MISIVIGLLTFVLVVNCLFLILLILIQLPKKEAGAGIAFGGGATDALFGSGSGNALTKMTKYSATVFLVISIGLTMLNSNRAKEKSRGIEKELSRQASTPAAAPAPSVIPANQFAMPVTTSNAAAATGKMAEAPAPSVTLTPTAKSTVTSTSIVSTSTTGKPTIILPTNTVPAKK